MLFRLFAIVLVVLLAVLPVLAEPAEDLLHALETVQHDAEVLARIKTAIAPKSDPIDVTVRKAAQIPTDEKYWAFRPVTNQTPPSFEDAAWVANPIDAFVLSRLRAEHLEPSPTADKRTLIRRVYLDVLGLPPTPEEVAAFVADDSADAYEKLIDQVLASQHYGERWARHWLDIIRFAETNGFETNTPRRNAWHYRDYVIQAFNEDKPYTDFIKEQLTGDLTGNIVATGFLSAGPLDEVKSPDIVLTKMQRDQEIGDMVATTGAAFLGLTVGCAKCHDHKFDPISQHDYYALRAVFAGVSHGERELPDPGREARVAQVEPLKQELASLRGKMLRLARDTQPDGLLRRVSTMENVDRFSPVEAKFVRFTVKKTDELEPCIDELEVYTPGDNPANVALAVNGGVATASTVFADNPLHRVEHLNDGRFGNARSWIPTEREGAWAQIELAKPTLIDMVAWARDREGAFTDRIVTDYEIAVSMDGKSWQTVSSSAKRHPFNRNDQLPALYDAAQLSPEEAATLKDLQNTEGRLKMDIKRLADGPRVYAARFTQPEPTYLLQRGDPMMDKQLVAPATPQFVGYRCDMDAAESDAQRRIKLAEWICDARNPLTARVMVNRIWQHHFGKGIVNSPSDFGAMGIRPTHPELLDWLATQLMDNGWRLKSIHKLILMSNTYRQSSAPDEAAMAVDAGSQWLWRFPPRRLDMEPIRDSILYVSGQLDLTMGGPGFDVFEPNDSYVHIYIPKTQFTRAEFRRMIYQWKPRMEQDHTFGVFDCPDAAQAMPKRITSTSPLQALSLLNSPFMMQQAEAFAERVKAEAGAKMEDQVALAYSLALCREAKADEKARACELANAFGIVEVCRALLNSSEFVYLN
ncbi:MAG: DUF1553 domain-containing protein [Candidatus Hydrogenedentes bacterium]|nr:DUF1553 domain-containing protein [Candidatus Hydrogenedentota bacterium]